MSDKITFKELVEKISANSKQSEQSTNDFIHELAEIIESSLGAGEKISISGFGKFELRWMDERKGRNPQSGDEITIPGQNKVVFKPYKALRERVNKPFESLESQVIGDEPDDKQYEPESPVLSYSVADATSPSGRTKKDDAKSNESEADLIFERESPVDSSSRFKKKTSDGNTPASNKPVTGADDRLTSVLEGKLSRQDKLARNVQDKGKFRWSYTAAAIIVLLAIFLFVFLVNRQQTPRENAMPPVTDQTEMSQSPDQDRQETETADPQPDETNETQNRDANNSDDQTEADSESSPPDVDEPEPKIHSVTAGESLWTIAQNQYNDPYLWPLIYSANQDGLDNPNELTTDSNLQVPYLDNPSNLSQSEKEKVALGYISVYDWILKNQPDNARYYLWAAGSFSQEVLQDASDNVNEADLAFATQG